LKSQYSRKFSRKEIEPTGSSNSHHVILFESTDDEIPLKKVKVYLLQENDGAYHLEIVSIKSDSWGTTKKELIYTSTNENSFHSFKYYRIKQTQSSTFGDDNTLEIVAEPVIR